MTTPTVLFVDDDAGVLRAMKRLFRKSSLTVLTAGSATEGLALLEAHEVQLVFADQRMPGMRGTDFLKTVRERFPNTVRCILSGYAEMESVVAAINDGNVYRFLAKPWDDEELTAVVQHCLERAAEIAAERDAVDDLNRRASDLEEQQQRQAEMLQLQEALLNSSRDVLERLPIAIAALDVDSRLIYANERFANQFGHLPGAGLGEIAAPPWRTAAEHVAAGRFELTVDQTSYSAHVAEVEIGGQAHTLIATVAG